VLFSVLNNATSGLRTTQALIDTASRNIANASTDGYHRKEQVSTSVAHGGVKPSVVQRVTNDVLTQQARKSSAESAYADLLNKSVSGIDRLFGDPAAEVSLPSRLSQLGEAFQTLATDPTRPLSRTQVISAADTLADTLRATFQAIHQEALKQQNAIAADVDAANNLIREVASINKQVPQLLATGQDTSDLIDQRDRAIEKLSQYLEVTGFEDSTGVFQLYTKDNKLLATQAPQLLSIPSPGVVAVGNIPPSPANAVWKPGGIIGARTDLANAVLPKYKTMLDDVAGRLAENFTAIGIELFNDGGAVPFDPLDPAVTTDFAGRIRVNDAVRGNTDLLWGPLPTPIGDLTAINQARDLLKPDTPLGIPFAGASEIEVSSSLGRAMNKILATVANDKQTAQADYDLHSTAYERSRELLSQETGVNIDDELARIIFLQNSYSASARVVSATQKMLDELMQVTR